MYANHVYSRFNEKKLCTVQFNYVSNAIPSQTITTAQITFIAVKLQASSVSLY
jgi:hypothetical protein